MILVYLKRGQLVCECAENVSCTGATKNIDYMCLALVPSLNILSRPFIVVMLTHDTPMDPHDVFGSP